MSSLKSIIGIDIKWFLDQSRVWYTVEYYVWLKSTNDNDISDLLFTWFS
jgi:hypothetical protein